MLIIFPLLYLNKWYIYSNLYLYICFKYIVLNIILYFDLIL